MDRLWCETAAFSAVSLAGLNWAAENLAGGETVSGWRGV